MVHLIYERALEQLEHDENHALVPIHEHEIYKIYHSRLSTMHFGGKIVAGMLKLIDGSYRSWKRSQSLHQSIKTKLINASAVLRGKPKNTEMKDGGNEESNAENPKERERQEKIIKELTREFDLSKLIEPLISIRSKVSSLINFGNIIYVVSALE